MIPSRTTADLLAGHWRLISGLGAVAGRLVWDNEAGIGRGRKLTVDARAFAGSLATRFVLLEAYDPESKGIVERANGFLETSFMPGRRFGTAARLGDMFDLLHAWFPPILLSQAVSWSSVRSYSMGETYPSFECLRRRL